MGLYGRVRISKCQTSGVHTRPRHVDSSHTFSYVLHKHMQPATLLGQIQLLLYVFTSTRKASSNKQPSYHNFN